MSETVERRPLTDAEAGQRPVIDFLSGLCSRANEKAAERSKASRSGQQPCPDTVISTHGAHVFLCGDQVFKIKRAVCFSYLDMTSLAVRWKLCEREVALNRPLLPSVYRGVLPITREMDGSLAIDGQGTTVEWAVHMTRFDQEQILDRLACNRQLDTSLASRLGESIADYHRALKAQPMADGFARIAEVVHELINEFEVFEALFSRAVLDEFREAGLLALSDVRHLLDQRASEGFVRRCHGDLHLRNLLLLDGRPVPFDALEFDERMATTDVLYDLAFLLMDLQHRNLPELANITFNHYLQRSNARHLDGLKALPLFLSARAGIRAMTTAQAMPDSADTSSPAALEARRYLAQAIEYLKPGLPVLVAIGGVSGSGKSTQAALLAPIIGKAPGALLLRSDVERKLALGVDDVGTRLSACHYTAAEAQRNYQRLLSKAAVALDAGHSVVVDAVFLDEAQREAFAALAGVRQLPFIGIWLQAEREALEHRIRDRQEDTAEASDATVSVLHRQLQTEQGHNTWMKVSSDGSRQAVQARIRSILP